MQEVYGVGVVVRSTPCRVKAARLGGQRERKGFLFLFFFTTAKLPLGALKLRRPFRVVPF